jgi:hypothetical protein
MIQSVNVVVQSSLRELASGNDYMESPVGKRLLRIGYLELF